MTVNKENVRKWVDALRSGEFEQGKNRLNRGGEFCCLGVACEVAIRDGVPLSRKKYSETYPNADLSEGDPITYDGSALFLPYAVQQWLGVDSDSPRVNVPGRSYGMPLAALNDDEGYKFADLADAIEETYIREKELVMV